MAGKKLEYDVEVDASGAVADLKKLGEAGEKAGKQIGDGFKDVGSKSEAAFDKVVSGLKDITTESKATIKAVASIGKSFGEGFDPDAASQLVSSLRKAGVEFDTIEGKADELVATLRAVDGVKLEAANAGLTNVKTGLGETTDAARGANSALANMVGNTAQDLGELGGVAGSSGVLIGQMAEYMSDAKLSGQAFGSVMKDFAKIVGPVAALAAATKLVGSVMDNLGAEAERSAGNVDALKEAMDGAQVSATDLLSTIQIRPELLTIPESVTVSWEDFGDSISAVVNGVLPFLGSELDTVDVANIFDKANISIAAFSRGVTGTVDDLGKLEAALLEAKESGIISNDEYLNGLRAIDLAIGEVADAEAEAAKDRKMFAVDGAAAQELMADAIKSSIDPLDQYTDKWATLIDALRSNDERLTPGQLADESDEAADAINVLSEALDMSPTDVVALAWERLNEGITANTDLTEENKQKQEELAKAAAETAAAIQEAAIDVGKVIAEPPDIAGALQTEFDKVDRVFDGLKFDVDFESSFDEAVEGLSGFEPDLQTLVDSWAAILSGENIEILGNVRADDAAALEAIGKVRDLVQDGIVNEFEQGGVDAANAFARSTAKQISEATGIPIQDIYKLLSLTAEGTVEAVIEPEVDAQHADKARAILDSLAGVEGGEAREARIHVALETGQIDGDVAYIASLLLAHEALGINVEPQLKDFTPAQIDAAQATIDGTGGVTIPATPELSDNWFDNLWAAPPEPVPVPVALTADNAGAIDKILDAVADQRRRADIDVKAPDAGKVGKLLDAVADRARPAEITAKPVNFNVVDIQLDGIAAPRTASITAEAHPAGANSALNGVARNRTAHVYAQAHTFEADRELDLLAEDRFADIYVRTHNTVTTTGGGGGAVAVPNAAPNVAGFAAEGEVGVNPLAGSTSVSTFGTPISVAGSTVAPVVHNHVTIAAAVIGSRFDVQRAVTKALRQAQRISGGRAA